MIETQTEYFTLRLNSSRNNEEYCLEFEDTLLSEWLSTMGKHGYRLYRLQPIEWNEDRTKLVRLLAIALRESVRETTVEQHSVTKSKSNAW